MRILILFVLSFIVLNNINAQILTFDFAGLTGDEPGASSNSNNANISPSSITRGSGLTASANGDRYNATSWALTSINNAVSGNDYMEFTITPNVGCDFSISSIVISLQRSSTGSRGIALRSSVDGFASNLDTEYSIPDVTATQTYTFTFTQSNLSSATTYRIYMWAEATTGSCGPGDFTGNDVIVNGSTSCGVSNSITTGAVTGDPFTVDCTNSLASSGSVEFTSVGIFALGNIYTAQLSDEFGTFASPTDIGTLSSVANSGTINFTIPSTTTGASTYRIRVISSTPAVDGTNNGVDLTIDQLEPCVISLPAQGLLINEFSNGASGSEEYYEFVVAGECGAIVDVRGYIIDDNNGTFSTVFPSTSGVAQGHLRLTQHAMWSLIPVGSLIVVYNADDFNPSVLPADDPFDANGDSLYVIPHNNTDLFEITDDLPSNATSDSTYSPSIYDQTIWSPLGIRNAGDAIQVRMPDGSYWHGISYGGAEISGGPDNMKISTADLGTSCGWFTDGDIFDISNWSTGDLSNETPGLPNNAANLAWLRLMRDPTSVICPITVLPSTTVNFSGSYENGRSILSWGTSSEHNNAYFTLFHSRDGINFRQIGQVQGSGNSTTYLHYQYIHEYPEKGINYYKLTSTDYDGTIYSKGLISILVDSEGTFYDQLSGELKFSSKSDYSIYTPDGKLIDRRKNCDSIPFNHHGIYLILDEKNGTFEKLFIP